MTYEYRVFVEGPEEISVSHFSSEKLWEGATFRASKPGHDVDGKVLVVYRLVSHPTEHGPGIAHGRVSATEKEPWLQAFAGLDAPRFFATVREGDSVAATPERRCGLYVLVDRPRLVIDLQEFLQELGFVAVRRRGDGLDVSIPGSSDTTQARRVVNVYLAIWQAIHPGVEAFITEPDDMRSSAA